MRVLVQTPEGSLIAEGELSKDDIEAMAYVITPKGVATVRAIKALGLEVKELNGKEKEEKSIEQ